MIVSDSATSSVYGFASPLDFALALARAGVPVFPCADKSTQRLKAKAPLTKKGFKDRSADETQIRGWWKKWPTALIGIVPGDAGAVVIDQDVKGRANGVQAFRVLVPDYEDLPAMATPSGGEHAWVAAPEGDLGNGRGGLPEGIDIRCDGGYVCLGAGYEDLGGVIDTLLDPEGQWPAMPRAVREALKDAPAASGSATRHDYTQDGYSDGYTPVKLSELRKHAPRLRKWEGEGGRSEDAYTWLLAAVTGMCQVLERDAREFGGDETKNLCELAIEAEHDFLGHYLDGGGWAKLGYDAERAIEQSAGEYGTGFDVHKKVKIERREQVREKAKAAEVAPLEIQLSGGELHVHVEQCEAHLIALGIEFYVRGGLLVRPVIEDLIDANNHVTQCVALAEVTPAFMRLTLCENVVFLKFYKTDEEWRPVDPPKDLVEAMLSRRGFWKYPTIGGVIATPTLRPDGSILSAPGFDETTSLYVASKVELPDMPDRPTREDALKAVKHLKGLIIEFPFVDAPSEAVGLSTLITPVVRGCMDVAPMHAATAPTAGTGKSYLFDTASAIAIGSRCPVMSAGKTEEELGKRIGAAVLSGAPIVCIDNVNGEIGGDDLCQVVEQPIVKVRILGKSEMPKVVNRFCTFANGNNMTVRGDMTRRTLLSSMDRKTERPGEHRFQHDPVRTVLADRGKYVAACLTIVRAYFIAGRPEVTETPMNSFGMWSDTVRSALIWLGCSDPCETIETARDNDPELQQLTQFIEAFKSEIGAGKNNAFSTSEIADMVHGKMQNMADYASLREACTPFMQRGILNTGALGRWLAKNKGRVIGELHIANRTVGGFRMWYLSQ